MDKDGSMALLDSKKLKAGLHTLTLGLGDVSIHARARVEVGRPP